jgi:hypothetical protein
MPTSKQMTYAELAAAWGVTSEAARKKVEGLRLPRQTGNDGKVRVLIDLTEVQHRPAKPRSGRRPAGDQPETDALRQHIITLQAEVERLTALSASSRDDFARERDRADKAAADLMTLVERLADAERMRATGIADAEKARIEATDAQMRADAVKAELSAWKAQPWWRRALG